MRKETADYLVFVSKIVKGTREYPVCDSIASLLLHRRQEKEWKTLSDETAGRQTNTIKDLINTAATAFRAKVVRMGESRRINKSERYINSPHTQAISSTQFGPAITTVFLPPISGLRLIGKSVYILKNIGNR